MLRILDKPAGLTTHTSLSGEERKRLDIDPIDSFLGHVSYRSGEVLFPVHRLDLGTTGVLLAADSREEASELAAIFESREIEKAYLFLTDRKPRVPAADDGKPTRVESFIDRHSSSGAAQGNSNFFSIPSSAENPTNAITDFSLVSFEENYSLWRARPLTGRPHQIRLHAAELGLHILGDTEHGGTSFPALCLHANEIKLKFRNENIAAESPPPKWFSLSEKFDERWGFTLVGWLAAVDRRERLARSLATFNIAETQTKRMIHSDGGDLRADQLGSIVQLHWYGTEFDDIDRDAVKELTSIMAWNNWYLQTRPNRGKSPTEAQMIVAGENVPTRWQASEESASYSFRRDTSMSAGLFLDQRANRRWVSSTAKGRKVLNLFSYTGGFSLVAALAGAEKVVSVDLSKNFINWSKENFELNALRVDDSRFEFRAMEAFDYLRWAKKKEIRFDLVICDPPSFSRSENGAFRIEKELENLWQACADVTNEGGRIIFALNYEMMSESEFFARAETWAAINKRRLTVERTPSADLDFEFPREARAMKSLFFKFV